MPKCTDALIAVGARLDFERTAPEFRGKRFYRMAVLEDAQLPLYAGEPRALLLVVARGHIGHKATLRRKRYTSPEQLAREWRKLRRLRLAHGYVVTFEGGTAREEESACARA